MYYTSIVYILSLLWVEHQCWVYMYSLVTQTLQNPIVMNSLYCEISYWKVSGNQALMYIPICIYDT